MHYLGLDGLLMQLGKMELMLIENIRKLLGVS